MTKKESLLSEEIARLHDEMLYEDPGDDRYETLLTRIAVLYELNKNKSKFEVSGDTIVLATVNLIGIVLILQHENLHVVSSKALSFVSKLRL